MIKKLMRTLVLALAALMAVSANAEGYPDKPVRIIHGFGPGGNADTVARIIAEKLTKRFGQPFVVEPKPGAGGNVASDFVAHADPDGYTLELMVGGHSVSGALYRSLKFNALDDFTFISQVTAFPFFIATRAGTYKDLQALITAGKEGRVKYGSAGVGTTQNLTGELLAMKSGAKFKHIPYKGDAGSVTALLGGEVDFIVATGTSVLGQAKSGQLDLIAVSWDGPWADTPYVPTVHSVLDSDYDVFSWTGLGGPKGLPEDIVSDLNQAVVEILQSDEVKSKIRSLGAVVRNTTPQGMHDMVERQINEWNHVIDAADIPRK